VPGWVQHVVWWHLYPLGFVGAPPVAAEAAEPVHRLRRLEPWLDYAIELGASGLALGPVFASHSHGYDTVDHFRIDPRLGDDGDFDALVAAAHRRGLRVLLDGVFNHVGRGFPAFAAVLRGGPAAPQGSWFHLSWPRPWRRGVEPRYATFEGHSSLVALNHAEPAVIEHVAAVMTYWLARGVDGWRLDAAYAVPPAFWAAVLPRVRAEHPEAYVVGEVIQGDYPAIVRASGMDAVTQYELWKAIWSSLNDGNFFELAHALDRHNRFLDTLVPLTFVGNHDVTRLASQLHDQRHLAHALATLLTVGGTPSIYAGDEQGFLGVKEHRAGGDDAVRPVFPDTPAQLAPDGWGVYRLHQQLIGVRRRHPWLHHARAEPLHLTNTQLVYQVGRDRQRLLVALNLQDTAVDLPAPGATAVAAGAAHLHQVNHQDARARLDGHGWAVLTARP
jgi:cyclomaltodextrinase / maltogenic alpha-amylase / neopullulanase